MNLDERREGKKYLIDEGKFGLDDWMRALDLNVFKRARGWRIGPDEMEKYLAVSAPAGSVQTRFDGHLFTQADADRLNTQISAPQPSPSREQKSEPILIVFAMVSLVLAGIVIGMSIKPSDRSGMLTSNEASTTTITCLPPRALPEITPDASTSSSAASRCGPGEAEVIEPDGGAPTCLARPTQ